MLPRPTDPKTQIRSERQMDGWAVKDMEANRGTAHREQTNRKHTQAYTRTDTQRNEGYTETDRDITYRQ